MGSNMSIPTETNTVDAGQWQTRPGTNPRAKVSFSREQSPGLRPGRWFDIIEDIAKRPVLMELVPLALVEWTACPSSRASLSRLRKP